MDEDIEKEFEAYVIPEESWKKFIGMVEARVDDKYKRLHYGQWTDVEPAGLPDEVLRGEDG